jgi:hypothetical protein
MAHFGGDRPCAAPRAPGMTGNAAVSGPVADGAVGGAAGRYRSGREAGREEALGTIRPRQMNGRLDLVREAPSARPTI